MTEKAKPCVDCGKTLISVDALAHALHSGCALLGYPHLVDQCPSKAWFAREADMLWRHMDRNAKSGIDTPD